MPTGVGNCPYYQAELPPGVDVVLFIHFGGVIIPLFDPFCCKHTPPYQTP